MKTKHDLKRFQRTSRHHPTHAEWVFAQRLRTTGLPFKQQMILGFYILDFVLPTKLIAIEIDGSNHDSDARKLYDERRTAFIRRAGFQVIRVRNEDAGIWDFAPVQALADYTEQHFRTVLSRANSLKSSAMKRTTNRLSKVGRPRARDRAKPERVHPAQVRRMSILDRVAALQATCGYLICAICFRPLRFSC